MDKEVYLRLLKKYYNILIANSDFLTEPISYSVNITRDEYGSVGGYNVTGSPGDSKSNTISKSIEQISGSLEFSEVLSKIKDRVSRSSLTPENYLKHILYKIGCDIKYTIIDKREINLSKYVYDQSAYFYVNGVKIKEMEYQLFPNVVIRRVNSDDLIQIQNRFSLFHIHPDTLFEIFVNDENNQTTDDEFAIISNAIKLFFTTQCNSPCSLHNSFSPPYSFAKSREFFSKSPFFVIEDPVSLSMFIEKVRPILSKILARNRVEDELSLALRWYNRSLEENTFMIQKLAYAIIGLESLFLNGSEKSELTFKLSIRVAKTLSYFNNDAVEVKRNVAKGYDLRSRFVHGEVPKIEDNKKIEELFPLIQGYFRKCLLLYLFLEDSGHQKGAIISLIDESLISQNDLEKLLIEKNNIYADAMKNK